MSEKKEKIDDLSCSPELIEGFIAEAKEHLSAVESDFLMLEEQKENPDPALLNKVFRSIHSVKGAAGFLGFEKVTVLRMSWKPY
jgi:two-component system chemotaxis sensor kinase CheA